MSVAHLVTRVREKLTSLAKASVDDERGRERYRRVLWTAGATALARGISIISMVISIRLTLNYLGSERFGIWATFNSLITVLQVADLGVGYGLLNAVSAASGKEDWPAVRKLVASAYVALSIVASGLFLVYLCISHFVSWPGLLGVSSTLARHETALAMPLFVACIALNAPVGIVQRTQTALQLGYIANLWQVATSILTLFALLIAIRLELGLHWLVATLAVTPLAIGLLNTLTFFGRTRRIVRPDWQGVTLKTIRELASAGLGFLVLQFAVSVAFASDNIVIAQVLGADAVAEYATVDKMFSIIPITIGMLLMPLWPAYGEAIARGDYHWIRTAFRRSLLIALPFALIVGLLLVVTSELILSAWLGAPVSPPLQLVLGLALWKLLEAWGIAVSAFLNGTNTIRLQAILAILMAGTAIVLKVIMTRKIGTAGVAWGTVIAYATFSFLPTAILIPRLLRRYASQA